MTITKRHFVHDISYITQYDQVVIHNIIECFKEQIVKHLRNGERIELRDFMIIEPIEKAARKARNPRTGESINVPASNKVKIRAGKLLRKVICPAKSMSL